MLCAFLRNITSVSPIALLDYFFMCWRSSSEFTLSKHFYVLIISLFLAHSVHSVPFKDHNTLKAHETPAPGTYHSHLAQRLFPGSTFQFYAFQRDLFRKNTCRDSETRDGTDSTINPAAAIYTTHLNPSPVSVAPKCRKIEISHAVVVVVVVGWYAMRNPLLCSPLLDTPLLQSKRRQTAKPRENGKAFVYGWVSPPREGYRIFGGVFQFGTVGDR